jgi:multidrug transporter EmrE-like cation transporter
VLSADIILVAIYCHFVLHELLNFKQIAAITAVLVGISIVAVCSSAATASDDEEEPVVALCFSLLAMLSFACVVLSVRVGAMGGLAAWSSFTVRMLVSLSSGTAAVGYSVLTAGWPDVDLIDWGTPTLAGLAQSAGVFCVSKALQYPNTGIANAIFESNSLDVLMLSWLVFGLLPDTGSVVGMVITMVSVAALSLIQDDAAEPEKIRTLEAGRGPSRMSSYGGACDLLCKP